MLGRAEKYRTSLLLMWHVPLGLREPAVSIADAGIRSETLLSFWGDAGLPPRPAQGLTPPLHPRKGHRPLTRFRWRAPWKYAKNVHAPFLLHQIGVS